MQSTLAGRVAERIARDYILSGQLGDGERLPSIRQLVEEYGASLATVAQALGQLEAQGIVEKRAGSGCYVRRGGLEGVQPRLPRLLGLVAPPLDLSEVGSRLLAGVQRAAHRHGCQVVLATHNSEYERERAKVAELLATGCEAIILSPSPRAPEELERDYLAHEFPDARIVLVDVGLPEHGRVQVLFDNFAAGYDMTSYLLDRGHRHIAFVRALMQGRRVLWRSAADRQEGYLQALRERGIVPRPQDLWLLEVGTGWTDGQGAACPAIYERLRAWREEPARATAVVGHADDFTVPAIAAARELGIAVPDELMFTGFDNLSVGHFVTPPFPTTAPDFEWAGMKAVQLALHHAREGMPREACYLLPVPLLPRDRVVAPAFQRAPVQAPEGAPA